MLIAEYQKEGYYAGSRQYNGQLLVMVQNQMFSASLDYTWTINGVQVNETIYQGVMANASAQYSGNAARSIAGIPLGSKVGYRLATFIFCDYTWDIILS